MIKELFKIVIGVPLFFVIGYSLCLLYGFLYNILADHIIIMFLIILVLLFTPIFTAIERGDL